MRRKRGGRTIRVGLETVGCTRLTDLEIAEAERFEFLHDLIAKAGPDMDRNQRCRSPEFSRFLPEEIRGEMLGGSRHVGHGIRKRRFEEYRLEIDSRVGILPKLVRGARVGTDDNRRV